MSGGVQIATDVLRTAGSALGQVGDQLEAQLNALEAELLSFGEPWGNDDIGQLIAVAYQEVVSYAFDCLRGVLNEIQESVTDLGAMADRYDAAEQDITDRFTRFFDQLGSR
jgi:hypothetical protein